MAWCILAGDTEEGGLLMAAPVAGLTIGMALRPRVAAGWCNLRLDCWLWKEGGTKGGDDELSENAGATCCGCWVGDESGDVLAREDRSEALWMDTSWDGLAGLEDRDDVDPAQLTSLSVSRFGQNSRSSSRSKDLVASKRLRKVRSAVVSGISFMARADLNCLLAFCETESLGALRFRPWWLCELAAPGMAGVGCAC